jgi:CRISPR/Cas system-associated endonuclease Cas1
MSVGSGRYVIKTSGAQHQALREHLKAAGCDIPFGSRTRRPPRDPVNAALGFAYGVCSPR